MNLKKNHLFGKLIINVIRFTTDENRILIEDVNIMTISFQKKYFK